MFRIRILIPVVLQPIFVYKQLGRIETSRAVEQLLFVERVLALLQRPEHTDVDLQQVVPHPLREVHIRHKRPAAGVLYHILVVDVPDTCAVGGEFSAAGECQVMVVGERCPRDLTLSVGVRPFVHIWQTMLLTTYVSGSRTGREGIISYAISPIWCRS